MNVPMDIADLRPEVLCLPHRLLKLRKSTANLINITTVIERGIVPNHMVIVMVMASDEVLILIVKVLGITEILNLTLRESIAALTMSGTIDTTSCESQRTVIAAQITSKIRCCV